jgi:hypothetical protein
MKLIIQFDSTCFQTYNEKLGLMLLVETVTKDSVFGDGLLDSIDDIISYIDDISTTESTRITKLLEDNFFTVRDNLKIFNKEGLFNKNKYCVKIDTKNDYTILYLKDEYFYYEEVR